MFDHYKMPSLSTNNYFTFYKESFRNIEKLTIKCANINSSIKFNKTCLTNELYPQYVKKIYIYKGKGAGKQVPRMQHPLH